MYSVIILFYICLITINIYFPLPSEYVAEIFNIINWGLFGLLFRFLPLFQRHIFISATYTGSF